MFSLARFQGQEAIDMNVGRFSNPNNATARTAVIAFADALAARFSPIVGCTRSWDDPQVVDDFEVCQPLAVLQV